MPNYEHPSSGNVEYMPHDASFIARRSYDQDESEDALNTRGDLAASANHGIRGDRQAEAYAAKVAAGDTAGRANQQLGMGDSRRAMMQGGDPLANRGAMAQAQGQFGNMNNQYAGMTAGEQFKAQQTLAGQYQHGAGVSMGLANHTADDYMTRQRNAEEANSRAAEMARKQAAIPTASEDAAAAGTQAIGAMFGGGTLSDERVKQKAYEAGKADERQLFADLDAEGRRTEDAFMHPDMKARRVGAELDRANIYGTQDRDRRVRQASAELDEANIYGAPSAPYEGYDSQPQLGMQGRVDGLSRELDEEGRRFESEWKMDKGEAIGMNLGMLGGLGQRLDKLEGGG